MVVKKENDIMTNEQLVARIQVGEDTAPIAAAMGAKSKVYWYDSSEILRLC